MPAESAPPSSSRPGEKLHRRAVATWRIRRDSEAARELFERARRWAEAHGDESLWRRASANLCALDPRPDIETHIRGQRQIIIATSNSTTAAIAANNLSRLWGDEGDEPRALFYASLAIHHACSIDDPPLLVSVLNQAGNVHLAACRLPEAEAAYSRALACRHVHSLDRATVLDNLGYCRLLGARHAEGLALLRASLRQFLVEGQEPQRCLTFLSLCQAALDTGRDRQALEYGVCALELARSASDPELLRNALFFAGEAKLLSGEEEEAHDLFSELGARFYPGLPSLAELLLVVDAQGMVNLRA